MGTRVIENEIVWKWKVEFNNSLWTLVWKTPAATAESQSFRETLQIAYRWNGMKWNNKEWESQLPVDCVAWILSSKCCKLLANFEYFLHHRLHICSNCFYLTTANRNLKNESLSSNNHESLSKSSFIIAHITQTSQTKTCNTSTRENSEKFLKSFPENWHVTR